MFNHFKLGIQQAFFDSLEQAGCLKLETENPESSDEEDEEWDDEVHGKRVAGSSGGEDEDDDDEQEGSEGSDSDSEGDAEPQAGSADTRVVGFGSFLRKNPKTDKFPVERVHHVEFWCADATNTSSRFSWALGMQVVAKSDLSTGNSLFSSYVLKGGDLLLCFTAPQSAYSSRTPAPTSRVPFPYFKHDEATDFIMKHGTAVRALALEVSDVTEAYDVSIRGGAKSVADPIQVVDPATGSCFWVAEVLLLGDVVLRFIKTAGQGPFLPNFSQGSNHVMSYGLNRLDHVVGAVDDLHEALKYIKSFTGFHEFEDDDAKVAEVEERSPLAVKPRAAVQEYSVLANNAETVLIPLIAPGPQHPACTGAGRFLRCNAGPGIQHLAIMCNDIVTTVQEMKARSDLGGLQFLPRPPAKYYKDLKMRLGPKLTQQQLEKYQELGILVDLDDRGILLQIFTGPVCDRLTFSLEIVQRISYKGGSFPSVGCGGFGSVNQTQVLEIGD